MPPPCIVCGGTEGKMWEACEMMLGLRDAFNYFECGTCGCLQLDEVPDDLGRYYPSGYYSFSPSALPAGFRRNLRLARNRYLLTGKGWIGALLAGLTRYPYEAVGFWFARNPRGVAARVLDVGCGAGALINDLAEVGYQSPLGVDPFLPAPVTYPSAARVLCGDLADVAGKYDLVLLNHVIEHVRDPMATLTQVRRLLAPGGECLVRTPLAGSRAWEDYRVDWVQLDAPRHLVIHSVDSMRRAADQAGLAISEIRFDSDELQFVGSELYRRGVSGLEARAEYPRGATRAFRKKARYLNAIGKGDQAAFVLHVDPATSR